MRIKILILTGFALLLFGCNKSQKPQPVAQRGVLDLTAWDFEKDGNVSLNGDWELYWNELISPTEFKNNSLLKPTAFCEVPSAWNNVKFKNENLPGKGCATYRLKIKMQRGPEQLSLKMLEVSSSYKLYVNDQVVASNGKTSCDIDSMQGRYFPLITTFKVPGNEFEIVIHVSNNIHSKGGLWNPIVMGEQQQIMKAHHHSYLYNMFVIGVMFILFIYHLWIHLMRRNEKLAMSFAMLCLNMFIRTIFTGERFVFVLFPDFPIEIGLKFEYLSLVCAGISCSYFYFYLFPRDFSKKVLYLIVVITMLELVSILILPADIYTRYIELYQICIVAIGIYICMVSALTVVRKRRSAVPFFICIVIIICCLINDILYANLVIKSIAVIPYAFLAYVLSQAYILASRIAAGSRSIEMLSVNLEHKVRERTRMLREEKKKSDDLLLNILPAQVAEELKAKGHAEARLLENVTVLFTDFKGFTALSEKMSPDELVRDLHECFTAFDQIMHEHGLEKIKTIGDAYMAAGGLPIANTTHATDVVSAALAIVKFIEQGKVTKQKNDQPYFEIRIGVHSGPVVAGIVGVKKFSYDIWGDTVNTASRMESGGEVGQVNISGSTYELVKEKFPCTHRGKIKTKGKGEVDMYFVDNSSVALAKETAKVDFVTDSLF